jgi:hypothetical protein
MSQPEAPYSNRRVAAWKSLGVGREPAEMPEVNADAVI